MALCPYEKRKVVGDPPGLDIKSLLDSRLTR